MKQSLLVADLGSGSAKLLDTWCKGYKHMLKVKCMLKCSADSGARQRWFSPFPCSVVGRDCAKCVLVPRWLWALMIPLELVALSVVWAIIQGAHIPLWAFLPGQASICAAGGISPRVGSELCREVGAKHFHLGNLILKSPSCGRPSQTFSRLECPSACPVTEQWVGKAVCKLPQTWDLVLMV